MFGFKEVIIEHSMEGTNWTPLNGVPEFTMAPGTKEYTSNITVDLMMEWPGISG